MDGIPPGAAEAVMKILRAAPEPVRRRPLLAELDRRGHRISLAGLNRVVEHCARRGWIEETPNGIRARRAPPGSPETPGAV